MQSRVFAEFSDFDAAEAAARAVKGKIDIHRITVSGGHEKSPAQGHPVNDMSWIPLMGSAPSSVGGLNNAFYQDVMMPPLHRNKVVVCIKAENGQAKRAASILRSLGAQSVKMIDVPV